MSKLRDGSIFVFEILKENLEEIGDRENGEGKKCVDWDAEEEVGVDGFGSVFPFNGYGVLHENGVRFVQCK